MKTNNYLYDFFRFIETETDLFEVNFLGYPWYWAARETLINGINEQAVFKVNELHHQIRLNDFKRKSHLLKRKYDYLFLTKAKMRRRDLDENENILIQDLLNYLNENNKTFLILEEPSNGLFDLKYFKSEHYENTLPYEFIYTLFEETLISEISKKKVEYLDIINMKFLDKEYSGRFNREIEELRNVYLNLGDLIRNILINQMLCEQLDIKALFGGMGNYKSAGLNNKFCIVEYEHGIYGEFNNSPQDSSEFQKYLYTNYKMENFFLMINSLTERVYDGPKKTYERNIFSLGLPEYRRYDFNESRLMNLEKKYSLSGSKKILIATNSSVDYELLYRFLNSLKMEFKNIKVLLRTHPVYENLARHKIDGDFIQLANDDKLYDLFSLCDIVISVPSSVVSEAFMFTDKVFVLFKENPENNRAVLEKKRYPFAHQGRLDNLEEFITQIKNLLICKESNAVPKSQKFVQRHIKELFKRIEHNFNSERLENSCHSELCLAIFLPVVGALSETFIQQHIQYLSPNKTVIITGNVYNTDGINVPILCVPFGLGDAKYTIEVEKIVEEFFKKHNVTHILIEYGCHGAEMVELNFRKFKLPIYVHFHGYDASQMLLNSKMVRYYKWMSSKVDSIIACSYSMADRLIDSGITREKIVVNHYGVKIPKSQSNQVKNQNCKFVFVGRLVAKKAPLNLLKAFNLAYQIHSNMRLDIVGDSGLKGVKSHLMEDVKRYIKINNLGQVVKLHGARSSSYVQNILKSSSVFVQHSITDPETGDMEGLPNSILEASSFGLPIISTLHSGIPEEVENGVTGYLVKENDFESMAKKMVELAFNSELRSKMGQNGRLKIQENFSTLKSINGLREIVFGKTYDKQEKQQFSISAIVVSYNQKRDLQNTIMSIWNQTVEVAEIIIVDNGSVDGTDEVVAQIQGKKIKYVKLEKHNEIQVARNIGIKNAKSEWLTFLDAGFGWPKGRMENFFEREKNNSDIVLVGVANENNSFSKSVDNVYIEFLKGAFVTFPNLFIKKKCFEEGGYLDESLKSWQEWDLVLRFSRCFQFSYENWQKSIESWGKKQVSAEEKLKDIIGYLQIVLKYKEDIFKLGRPVVEFHLNSLLKKIYKVERIDGLTELENQILDLKNRL